MMGIIACGNAISLRCESPSYTLQDIQIFIKEHSYLFSPCSNVIIFPEDLRTSWSIDIIKQEVKTLLQRLILDRKPIWMGDLSLPSTVMKMIVKLSKTPNTDHGHEQLAKNNPLSRKNEGPQQRGLFFQNEVRQTLNATTSNSPNSTLAPS